MELKIDQEFEELIPPLTKEEFIGLEESILTNGFDSDHPIITWNGVIVDGHNRYNICSKHNVEFVHKEKEFPSRSAVIIWMIDEQTKRRNINEITRAYLIGTRYMEEKKVSSGRPVGSKECPRSEDIKRTTHKIAEQSGVGHATVERASIFSKALNALVTNTGIKRSLILAGAIKTTMKDIVELSKCEVDTQEKVINKVTNDTETDIRNAIRKVKQEDRDREIKESEERKRRELESLRKELEEKERLERERIRKEREENERLERERVERERVARDNARKEREEQERLKRVQWEKEEAEKERIRKEVEEKERIEREKLRKEREEKARIEKERLEKERIEIERIKKERLERERTEKEKAEKERLERKRVTDEAEEKRRLEQAVLKQERLNRERIEHERLEKERIEKYKLEKERMEKERLENERLECERLERERVENERLVSERIEHERIEKERLAKARIERERVEAERIEHERIEKEKLEQFKLEQDRIENERIEAFRLEQERIEQERLEAIILSESNRLFNVILCDPPWRYDFAETKNREIENQYPTMSIDEIKAIEIPADDDCVMFMWATAPKLEQAFDVLKAWGFEYKTCAVWDKEMIGMGYWFRGQHELLLVGTKGRPCAPEPSNRYSSVIRARREGHSKKPECVFDMIEKMCPNGDYLEMFARSNREKWKVWGNQV